MAHHARNVDVAYVTSLDPVSASLVSEGDSVMSVSLDTMVYRKMDVRPAIVTHLGAVTRLIAILQRASAIVGTGCLVVGVTPALPGQ